MRFGHERRGHGPRGFGRGGFGKDGVEGARAFFAMGWGRGGFGGPPGWGERGERGGGRRRVFDSGELRLVLLKLIADQPRHGYDLIRAIEELTRGAYAPSPGVVYPTITMLQDMELIAEAAAEGARKAYAITPEGTAHLAGRADEIEALFQRLAALGEMREKAEGAPIRRAMHNLRAVLQNRLTREDVDKDVQHAVAAILDEAAQRIERL